MRLTRCPVCTGGQYVRVNDVVLKLESLSSAQVESMVLNNKFVMVFAGEQCGAEDSAAQV